MKSDTSDLLRPERSERPEVGAGMVVHGGGTMPLIFLEGLTGHSTIAEAGHALCAGPDLSWLRGPWRQWTLVIDTKRGLDGPRRSAAGDASPISPASSLAMVTATDPDDLASYSPEVLEAMLRKTYTRLGKREGSSHVIFDFQPESPGQPEMHRDLLGRHAVHRRLDAGGDPRQGRRHPLHGASGAASRPGIAPAARRRGAGLASTKAC